MGGDLCDLLPRLLGDHGHGGAADGHASRGAGATTVRHYVGVAVQHLYVERGDSQLVGDYLGEAHVGALAMGRHAGAGNDLPGRLDVDPSVLNPHFTRGASHLHHGGEPDANQWTPWI